MKPLAFRVDELGAQTAHLLGDELADNLLGVGHAGRVVLDRIHEDHLGAGAIPDHQAVRRRAIMIGARELLHVEPPHAAGRQNHGFGAHHPQFLSLHVVQDRTGALSLGIQQQLDR